MIRPLELFAVFALSSVVPACAPVEQDNHALRQSLDAATISLRDTVALGEQGDHTTLRATVLTKSAVFSVVRGGSASGLEELRLDPAGELVSTQPMSGELPSCPGSVGASQALAAAEAEVGGQAVTFGPDDDDACDREVKVLDADDVLWEIKVAPDGSVKESEVADDADETEG